MIELPWIRRSPTRSERSARKSLGDVSESVTVPPVSTFAPTNPASVSMVIRGGATPPNTAKRAAQRVPLAQNSPTDPSALR